MANATIIFVNSDQKSWPQTKRKIALAGNWTQIYCLEGSNAYHYTTNALLNNHITDEALNDNIHIMTNLQKSDTITHSCYVSLCSIYLKSWTLLQAQLYMCLVTGLDSERCSALALYVLLWLLKLHAFNHTVNLVYDNSN